MKFILKKYKQIIKKQDEEINNLKLTIKLQNNIIKNLDEYIDILRRELK